MNLDEEAKKLKKIDPNNPPPLAKMASILAASLSQAASQYAFKLFRDRKFRQFLEFDKLKKIEQDRIFNELVVTNLILLMLTLEAPDLRMDSDVKDYFFALKDELPKAHVNCLRELGIEEKYLRGWRKLIHMRYEEYSKDKHEARQAAMEIESRQKELTTEGLVDIQLLLPVQTVAIGCHYHLLRGKVRGKDELFKLIVRSLGRFYVEVRVPLEGGKITFGKKNRVKIRHLWCKTSSY